MDFNMNTYRTALASSGLPRGARTVALVLASRAGTRTGACWPRVATVADDAGLQPRQVRRWLARLEDEGWITRSARYDKTGRRSNLIRLSVPGEGVTDDRGEGVTDDRGEGVTDDRTPLSPVTPITSSELVQPREALNGEVVGPSVSQLLDELGIRRRKPA